MLRSMMLELLLRVFSDSEPGPAKKRMGSWLLRNVPGLLTCAQFEEFVFEYSEGTLPEQQRARFETHLALCPMCRVHFDSYVRATALGQLVFEEDGLPEDMPEELVGAILIAIEE